MSKQYEKEWTARNQMATKIYDKAKELTEKLLVVSGNPMFHQLPPLSADSVTKLLRDLKAYADECRAVHVDSKGTLPMSSPKALPVQEVARTIKNINTMYAIMQQGAATQASGHR